jgi:uncharacterized membrane protein
MERAEYDMAQISHHTYLHYMRDLTHFLSMFTVLLISIIILIFGKGVRLIVCSQNMYLMVENVYPKSEMNSKSIPITLYTNI